MTDSKPPLPDTPYVLAREGSEYEAEYLLHEAGYTDDQLRAYADAAVAQERERCARLVDSNADACVWNSMMQQTLRANAAAIRAKGNK